MSKPLKYEKPRLINLSTTEWEIGAGRCQMGSSAATSPNDPNCINGERASPTCSTGTGGGTGGGS
jgi:hypothetical protein